MNELVLACVTNELLSTIYGWAICRVWLSTLCFPITDTNPIHCDTAPRNTE